ncbi:MAG: hypothetical protein JXQ23_06460 [Clostridia bacterium]|nr:hypothetical protein [Clostridia bacterium]
MSFMYGSFLNDTKLLVFVLLIFSMFFTVFVAMTIISKLKQNKLLYPYMIYQLIVFFIQFFAIIKLISTPDMFVVLTRMISILSVYLESLFLILVFSLVLEKTPSLPFMLSMIAIPFVIMNIIIIVPNSLFVVESQYVISYEFLYLIKGIYKYVVALISTIIVFIFIYRIKGHLKLKDMLLSLLILIPVAFDVFSRFFQGGTFEEVSHILLFTTQVLLLYTISQKWAFKLLNTIQRNTLNLINDGIIIVNYFGTVIYSNNNGLLSHFENYESENQLKGMLIDYLEEYEHVLIEKSFFDMKDNYKTELKTIDGQYYLCNINKLQSDHYNSMGVIVSFIEITEYKQLIDALQEKNINLDKANNELEDQQRIISNLNKMKEEEKISQEIRDLLANTMTQILTSLKACEILLLNDQHKAKSSLVDVRNVADNYLKRVRKMVSSLKENKEEVND